MKLKEKIQEVLERQKYTYLDLANHLGVTERDLDFALENNTLEIRVLELISKELRIPLYSFFRDIDHGYDYTQEPYYNINIWSKEETALRVNIVALQKEIEMLKGEMRQKDLLIEALESQLKKK